MYIDIKNKAVINNLIYEKRFELTKKSLQKIRGQQNFRRSLYLICLRICLLPLW